MSPRATNLVLFALVPLLVLSGLLAWASRDDVAALLIGAHRAIGAALLVALAWKQGVVRRSIRRRVSAGSSRSLVVGSATSIVLLLALGLGLAWTVGLISFDRPLSYSLMNIHVIAGIALVPLVIAHTAERWAPVSAPGRRDAIRALAVLAAGAVVAAVTDRVDPVRRGTGSRQTNTLPVTTWTFDRVPDISDWRLHVSGAVRAESVHSYEGVLGSQSVTREVVLDCTGGWWSAQRWRGVPLPYLFEPLPGASRVRIVSLTGHSATFDLPADDVLLATHVGGEPLTLEHGYPVRVVAPGHRGFMWVKWVSRVEVL